MRFLAIEITSKSTILKDIAIDDPQFVVIIMELITLGNNIRDPYRV